MTLQQDHLKKLIANYSRRLQALKERQALYGLDTPVAILTEIEDIEFELESLQEQLAALDTSLPSDDIVTDNSSAVTNDPVIESVWDVFESRLAQQAPLEQSRSTRKSGGLSSQPARIFISFHQQASSEAALAAYLGNFLITRGYTVFTNQANHNDPAQLNQIDHRLKRSHFLVVLLSTETANSEMVQAEVRRAYEYRKQQGSPLILPVRVAYEGLLPYSIDAFLNPLQYAFWRSEADNERVGRDILAAISGHLPQRPLLPRQPDSEEVIVSEDGHVVIQPDQFITPPLPNVDPRFLQALEAPGGAVKLRDKFYIERGADAQLKREVVKPGTTTTIRAPYQTGKSSLLVRAVKYASQRGAKVVPLDLQRVDIDYLTRPDRFLHYLAGHIARSLRLDLAEVERIWQGDSGPQDKLTYFMEEHVLPAAGTTVILAMDEVDRLLRTHFYTDFFGLLRSWHNNRAIDEIWDRLNLVMVISTEPYRLIADPAQSPFNVGLKLYLEDFSEVQVRDLNKRHGGPIKEREFTSFFDLLNGHPYLTRKALYTLVVKGWAWPRLLSLAAREDGPFSDHLRRHDAELRNEPQLREGLKEVIVHNRCPDEQIRFSLMRAGLIKEMGGEACACRCDLYRLYFERKL